MRKIFRTLRRARKHHSYPKMLVPVTRGPLLGYYHFLLGYFVPSYWYMLKTPHARHVLLQCGPMDKWFEWLPQEPAQTIDAVEGLQTAHRAQKGGFARGYVVETFTDWDLYKHFGKRPLRVVSEHLRKRVPVKPRENNGPEGQKKLIILARDHVPEELAAHPTRQFGSAKRNIPNLLATAHKLRRKFSVEIIDGSAATPTQMLEACRDADLLVGQHGAGLANALFLPPAARVLEIGWLPSASNSLGHFKSLSHELGLGWTYAQLQDNRFSSVESAAFEKSVDAALEGPNLDFNP